MTGLNAAAPAELDDSVLEALDKKGFVAGSSLDRVGNFRIHSWNYVDRRAVIFNVGASSHYLVTTRNTCSALRGAATIGFSATYTNVTIKDRLVVRGNDGLTDTCLIDQIVKLHRMAEPVEP